MLEIQGLEARYGPVIALAKVGMRVERGEIVALLGSNGAGKSTLLGSITKSVACRIEGSIRLDGIELSGMTTDAIIAQGLVLVPEGRQLFPQLTVEDNLRMGAYTVHRGRTWRSDLAHVYAFFPRLIERRKQRAATLSGGEQQMVAIGRALMARPRFLLLDEPSLGLAPLLVREIFGLIRDINREGVTILLVEQNVRQALRISQRGYVLEKGRIALHGRSAELMGDPHVVEAYLGQD